MLYFNIIWIVLLIAFVGVSIYYYGRYYTNEFTDKITYNEKSNTVTHIDSITAGFTALVCL